MRIPRRLSSAFILFLLFFLARPGAAQPVDTFRVTTEEEDPEHPYYQEGFSTKFAIDGEQGKELVLEKGNEYHFQMDGVEEIHPFYISTDSIGQGDGQYDQGVDGNRATGNDTLTFTPPTDAPDSLWYQCVNHAKMGWRMAMVIDSSMAQVDSDGDVSFTGTGVTIGFSGTSGSDTVQVDKFNSAPDTTAGIEESNVSKYRFVIRAGEDLSFGSDTEIRFLVDSLRGIGDASNVTVYHRPVPDSGSFTARATNYDSESNELIVSTDTFGEFVFASDSEPLPVELARFDAHTDGRAVQLSWETVSESGNAGFEVQRRVANRESGDASWNSLGFVESKTSGTSTQVVRYHFQDDEVPYEANRIAYRLRQVDEDGSSSLSGERVVEFGAPTQLTLHPPFPNPTSAQAGVRFALPEETDVQLDLYNVLGERVMTLEHGRQPAGRREIRIETSRLASGTYVLRLIAGGQVQTEKLTIVR